MFICATNMVLPHPMREANTYQESLPQHFCQPCMGTLSNSAIRKLPDGSCPKLVDETSKMLKLLRKDFRASGANMRKLKRLVFERENSPADFHPINITDLMSDSKLKRLIRWRNKPEYLVELTYARVAVLTTYFKMVPSVYRDDLNEQVKQLLADLEKQLRESSCKLYELITEFQLRKPSKKLCKFTKTIMANNIADGLDYVLSILQHGPENMEHILNGISELKEEIDNCILSKCGGKVVIKCKNGPKRSTRMGKGKKNKRGKRRHRRCHKVKGNKKINRRRKSKRCRKHRKRKSREQRN